MGTMSFDFTGYVFLLTMLLLGGESAFSAPRGG